MRISDYKCTNDECKMVFEYVKDDDLANFPDSVECDRCGADSKRIWGFGAMDVAQGKLGNSKDGYRSGCVNHPSSMIGKVKGTHIKK
jgi:hypothetical protein